MMTIPLALVPAGNSVTIAEIRAGSGMLRRLMAIGLCPSSRIEIICADRGSLIVAVSGCRYALSRGIAMRILVEGGEAGA
jgi:ferrous iron transport protein A